MVTDRRVITCGALVLVLVLGVGIRGAAAERKRYDDQKIVRADLKAQAHLDALRQSGAIVLDCIPAVKPTTVVATQAQLDRLEQLGVRTHVLVENAQAWMDAQRPVVSRADPFTDFFLDYHEYGSAGESGTIVWYLNELLTRYPSLVSIIDVGTTIEARTIWGLRITNDAITDKPGVIYFADVHAREWITPTATLYLANYLLENYGTDATATDLVDNVEIFLIPVVNVDGYIYSWTTERWWRKNRRNNGDGTWGVDINRNWGFAWGYDDIGSSPFPSDETYRGTGPFSEPETQAMRDLFYAHPNVRAMLDIHSYGELILWPWGYISDPPPDQDVYVEVGFGMQSLIYDVHGHLYAAGPENIYTTNGDSTDWTYGELDVFSIAYELRPVGSPWFELPPEEIIPNNEEILPANLYLTNSDWVRAVLRFSFPNGIPSETVAGTDTTIDLRIIEQLEPMLPDSASLYYRYDPTDPFIESDLVPTGGDAYTAVLPATNCTSTPEFYFAASSTGGTTITSPKQAPAEGLYTTSVSTSRVPFFNEDLSTNPGWTTEGAWAWGQPTGGGGEYGGPDPTSGHTGNNVHGYNLSGDYPNNLPERHLTTTTAIDCSGRYGMHVSFWRWLGVEQPAYDHAYVRVSNNGTDWTTVWANTGEITDSFWTLQDIDISTVADNQATVYLRWTMGATDGGWRYCGWNIDDISLTSAVCEGIAGDYNGDGDVDTQDYDEFVDCFTGPGGSAGPGCGFFDVDDDNDVDCDDWDAFKTAWTGPGDLPVFGTCTAFAAPAFQGPAKNRYLSFTPGTSMGVPQAFRVTTMSNPLFPGTVGQMKWVGPPDAEETALLQCDPAYRVWALEPVHAGDGDIMPGATYAVEATLDGVGFLSPVSMQTVPLWGDVAGDFVGGSWTGPDGTVDFNDITAVVDCFRVLPGAPIVPQADLAPGRPDRVIDFDDIPEVVAAFLGLPYPFDGAGDCP